MQEYIGESSGKKSGFLFLILFLIIIAGVGFLFIQGKKKLVSPIPSEPTFEVIFYTPTPGQTTPTSTPSATPKVKLPTSTPKPSPKTTVSPTVKATVSPTVKLTATPSSTPKPTI